jgi:hypothetical protein
MAAKTNYLAQALGNLVLNGGSYTHPSALYLGLYTGVVDATYTATEFTGGSYARQVVTFGSWVVNIGNTSATTAQFTNLPSLTCAGFFLLDASSGGNPLYYCGAGNGFSSITFLAGDSWGIPSGGLIIDPT